MKKLLVITAVFEAGTGIGLLVVPSVVTQVLFGGTLDSPIAVTVARVAGAALLALGVACWLSRENGRALVAAMLLYNVVVVGVLIYAALALALAAPGLWPVIALHLGLAFWCIACLRSKPAEHKPAR